MSGCVLCERMEHYEMADKTKSTVWSLVRDRLGWSLDVTVENMKLGVAFTTRIPVEHCPECGKDLNG